MLGDMAKILFTHSYFYRFDDKQWANKQPYPPYGTIYAAALMRADGHEVALFDTNLAHAPSDIVPTLDDFKPDFLVIYDDGFNYLTKMCLVKMREAAFELTQLGKQRGCTVVISSSDSTDHFDKYLERGADCVLLGEGELTLQEFVNEWVAHKSLNLSGILGIAYATDGKYMKNARRPVIRNLDDLPDPAWDLIRIDDYKQIWMDAHGYFGLNIATTRGCPYKCNWCAKPIYGNRYNSRSPERVAQELDLLTNTYGATYFWVCDDIFGLKPGWVPAFKEALDRCNLAIRYKIQSRADLLLEANTIDVLAQSGLDEVWIGAESGAQKILDAMDKGTTVEQIYEATRLLKARGVRVAFFLQFGYLGETKADIALTIQMLLDLMPHDIGVSVSYPLPETKFYERVREQLQTKQNWNDSDDLAMLYPATYSPAYYKRLHRYVHKLYRRKQAVQTLQTLMQKPLPHINKHFLYRIFSWFYYAPAAWIDGVRLSTLETQTT